MKQVHLQKHVQHVHGPQKPWGADGLAQEGAVDVGGEQVEAGESRDLGIPLVCKKGPKRRVRRTDGGSKGAYRSYIDSIPALEGYERSRPGRV